MERNILIGNGINIAFSENDDYKNFKIIERLNKNIKTKRYNDVFENTVEPIDLINIISMLNEIFEDMFVGISYVKYTENENELRTLLDMAERYKGKEKGIYDIGMEDYFFIMKIACNKIKYHYKDDPMNIEELYTGLRWLFLDSIYNNGKIEKLHFKMGRYAKELELYQNIFTLNYDTNLDRLTEKEVYHIHGSFKLLEDKYLPETLMGCVNQKLTKPNNYIKAKEHIYCNAIMAYTGEKKMLDLELPRELNRKFDGWINRFKNDLDVEAQNIFNLLKCSKEEKYIDFKVQCDARFTNPNLRHSEYPIDKFNSIKGELHILGMSPNNDNHIFKMINRNPNIESIVYYYVSDEDIINAKKVIQKPLETINVFEYWEKIKSK